MTLPRTHVWRNLVGGAGTLQTRARALAFCGREFDHEPGSPTEHAPKGADCLACLRALATHKTDELVRIAEGLTRTRQALELAESKSKSAPQPRRAITKTTSPDNR